MQTKKTRKTWSDNEKKQLCEFVKAWTESHGRKPEWREVKRWWEADHPEKTISQSTLSLIIRNSDEYINSRHPNRLRHRSVQFPRLHDALYAWMRENEHHTKITGPILREKAKELFPQLYPGEEMLKFSNGWLDGWKQQYGIKVGNSRTLVDEQIETPHPDLRAAPTTYVPPNHPAPEPPLEESSLGETDEQPSLEPKVTLLEAVNSLEKLLIWDEQQEGRDKDPKVAEALWTIERDLRRRRMREITTMQRMRLEDFFVNPTYV